MITECHSFGIASGLEVLQETIFAERNAEGSGWIATSSLCPEFSYVFVCKGNKF